MLRSNRSLVFWSCLALAVAIGVRAALHPLLGQNYPFILLFGAIALTVWLGGLWPSVLVAAAGYALSNLLFVPPYVAFGFPTVTTTLGALGYSISAAIIITFGVKLRTARAASARAEAAQATQASLLRLTLASIGDAVITTDAAGRITFMNPVAEHLTEWTLPEARGRSLGEVCALAPSDADEAGIRSAAGAIGAGSAQAETAALTSRAGALRLIENTTAPISDASGQAIGEVVIFRDVTRQRELQHELAASESLFRTIGEVVPDLLLMALPSGEPVYLNPAWLAYTGAGHGDIRARGWEAFFLAEDLATLRDDWRTARQQGCAFTTTLRVRRHDGVLRWFRGHTVPVIAPGGHVGQWISTLADIDDLKMAEMALADSSRRKDEFLALLAHELRNPLAPLSNAVNLLQLQPGASAPARTLHAIMDRQLSHLVRLVDDLLELSRVTSGKLEIRPVTVPVATVVATAVETTAPLIAQLHHRLVLPTVDHALVVRGDPVRLAQIVTNLLTNAARYTPDGGTIEVLVTRSDDTVCIAVRDSGVGIPPSELPHVFEMFTRGKHAQAVRDGLGIGLALASRLTELHGGRLDVASAGEGEGSTFTLYLPLVHDPEPSPRPMTQTRTPAPTAAHPPHRILVVDDNVDAAESLGMLLRLLGASVATANSGAEALQLLTVHAPALVLLDLGMPGMDGYEVLQRIRSMELTSPVRVVALTGWGQMSDRRRVEEAGFDQHLVKPVDLAALETLLTDLTNSSGSAP